MKRIRLYLTILGLLACAAVANAQQQLTLNDASGNPVAGAQVFLIAAGAKKIVQLPKPTDEHGAIDLSVLGGMENITNKTLTIYVEQCGNQPPIELIAMPGQTPPQKPDCRRWKMGAWKVDRSGTWTQVPGSGEAGAPYSVQVTGTPAVPQAPVRERPSFFNAKASFNVGFWKALDFRSECAAGVPCSLSDMAFALEGAVGPSFGPVDLLFGGFHTSPVSVTQTQTFTSGTATFTATEMVNWHLNAAEYGVRPNLLGISLGGRRLGLGVQGGGWVGSVKGNELFSTSTGQPTGSSGGTPQSFSFGVHAPWWGAHAEWSICKRLAATFDYKHADLHHNSFTENMNFWGFGVSVSAAKPTSIFEVGSGWPPRRGW